MYTILAELTQAGMTHGGGLPFLGDVGYMLNVQ